MRLKYSHYLNPDPVLSLLFSIDLLLHCCFHLFMHQMASSQAIVWMTNRNEYDLKIYIIKDFWTSQWLTDKESTCQCRRRRFSSLAGKIPWRRNVKPTPVFLPGKAYGQRSLVGYSLWDLKRTGQDWGTKTIKNDFWGGGWMSSHIVAAWKF